MAERPARKNEKNKASASSPYCDSADSGIVSGNETHTTSATKLVSGKQHSDMKAKIDTKTTNAIRLADKQRGAYTRYKKTKFDSLPKNPKNEMKLVVGEPSKLYRSSDRTVSRAIPSTSHIRRPVNRPNFNRYLKVSNTDLKQSFVHAKGELREKPNDITFPVNTVKVWKLNENVATTPRLIYPDLTACNAEEPQPTTTLPPLTNETKVVINVTADEIPPTENSNLISQSGSVFGGSSFNAEKDTVTPLFVNDRTRHKSSSSSDYRRRSLNLNRDSLLPGRVRRCSSSSRNDAISVASVANSAVRSKISNAPSTAELPLTAPRHSSNQNSSIHYNSIPNYPSGRLRRNSTFTKNEHIFGERYDTVNLTVKEAFMEADLGPRCSSVYSPSSGGSCDKQYHRYLATSSGRRISLPNPPRTYLLTEKNTSQEFCQTIDELTHEFPSHFDVRTGSERPTPSVISTSSVNSTKEQSISKLQQITEETQELPSNSNFHVTDLKAEKESSLEVIKIMQHNELTEQKIIETKHQSQMSNEVVKPTEEDSQKEMKNATENVADNTAERKSVNIGEGEPKSLQKSAQSANKPSLFDMPQPGQPTKKITSKLKHTTEISRNEENRHFVYGLNDSSNFEAAIDSNYFDRIGLADDDDIIDDTILDEKDDHLSEYDYQRKRIIRWLLDMQVQNEENQDHIH